MVPLRFVALFVGLSVGTAALTMKFGSWSRFNALAQSGVVTSGSIVSTNCRSHGWFTYRYKVDGHIYQGDGNNGASKPCSELMPGDSVAVVYLPTDPAESASGNPTDLQRSWLVFDVLLSLILSAIITIALHYRHRRRTGA